MNEVTQEKGPSGRWQSLAKRGISLVLAAALVLTGIPAQALSDKGGASAPQKPVSVSEPAPTEPYVLGEIGEKRQENVKHFRMSDGSIQACVYPESVHYLEDGQYVPIDNTLTERTGENGKKQYENRANAVHVTLPGESGEEYISFSDEQGFIRFRLLGATHQKLEKFAEKENNGHSDKTLVEKIAGKAAYHGIKEGVDAEYEVCGSRLKETLVLQKKTKERFLFQIETSAARAEKREDGTVVFYDESGAPIYTMAAPFLRDSAGDVTNGVAVTLEKTEGGYLLEYAPDTDWLWAKERVYPVRLDPTLSPSTDDLHVQDTYVYNGQTASSPDVKGWLDLINIGRRTTTVSGGAQMVLRGYFYFQNPVKLSETDCLISAKLTMVHDYAYNSVDGTQIDLFALTEPFSEGSATWHDQPAYDPELIDYAIVDTDHMLTATKSCDVYDITKLVSRWLSGEANYGLLLKLHNEDEWVNDTRQVYYFAKDNLYHGATAQYVSITYRDTRGLEGYWNYTSQNAGASGTGYVNNYNGSLTFLHEDCANETAHTAFTVTHGYSSVSRKEETFFGSGWSLNLCQRLEPVTLSTNTAVKYAYTDGDGTKHYLVDTGSGVRDEDGLGYTYSPVTGESGILGKLTDKSGNVLKFDTHYNLTEILDANGNRIDLQFQQKPGTDRYYLSGVVTSSGERSTFYYNTDYRLSRVTDNAGRETLFTYTGSDLTKITRPDGTYTEFTYTDHSLMTVRHSMGYGVKYAYSEGKVSTAEAFGKSGTSTGVTAFEYRYLQTKITDPLGQWHTLQFDTAGRVTGAYNDRGQICGQSFTPTSLTAGSIFRNNKVSSATGASVPVTNLVKNGGFGSGLDGWILLGPTGHYSTVGDKPYVSANSAKIAGGVGEDYTIGRGVDLPAGGTYTLSAYLRLEKVTGGRGAAVRIITNQRDDIFSEFYTGSTDPEVDGGYRRATVTVELNEGEYIRTVYCGLYESGGVLYVNGFQLEAGSSANFVNLLDNAGFEGGSERFTAPSGGAASKETVHSGTYSYRIAGDTTENRRITQTMAQSGRAGDVYTFGGWASIHSVPDNHPEHPAKMLLEAVYADGTTETAEAPFNVTLEGTWQCASSVFVAKEDYTSLRLSFCYDKNANYGYTDDVFLYRDTVQSYTYDENGNVLSTADKVGQASSFQYGDNSLTKLIQPTGEYYSYRYDGNKNMVYAVSGSRIGYAVAYDRYGNATESILLPDDTDQPLENGKVYYIKNRYTGKSICAVDPKLSNLSNVVQRTYDGSDQMKFQAVLVPGGYYVLRPVGSDIAVLSYHSRYETHTAAEIDTVGANDTSIEWMHLKITLADVNAGSYNISARMAENGAYYTVRNKSTAENAQIELDYKDGSAAQQWYFVEVKEDGSTETRKPFHSGASYYVRNVETGQFLSIQGTVAHMSNVSQNGLSGDAQRWVIKYLPGNGCYTIRPEGYPALALTYLSRTQVNTSADVESTGAGVDTTDWSHWLLTPAEDGSGAYRISAPPITNYSSPTGTDHLAVKGSSHDRGADVRMEKYTGLDSQKWVLVEVTDRIVSSATYTSNGAYADKVTDSRGKTTDYDYDLKTGLLSKVTDAKGHSTAYTYNGKNDRLESVTTEGSTVRYQYLPDGSISSITAANGTCYTFSYDEFGRTTEIRVGELSLSGTEYLNDETGLISRVEYGNGSYRTYAYDEWYRLTGEYVDGEQTAAYTYDKLDRLVKYQDLSSGILWEFTYDLIGRTTGIYASDGRYLGYSYDGFDRTAQVKEYVGGKQLTTGYLYDDNNNTSYKTGLFRGVSLNGEQQLGYGYDDLGRRTERWLYTDTPFVTRYTYTPGAAAGTTTTLIKTLQNGSTTLEYAYDDVGNISSYKKNGSVYESYTYDALNQLTSMKRGGTTYGYTYDNAGNLLSQTENGVVTRSYTYGDPQWKDRLTAFNGNPITYDEIGNPIEFYNGFVFTWENGRQLQRVQNGQNTYTYTYDGAGRRTSKNVNGTVTEFFWVGDTLQAQKTGNEYLIFLYDESGIPYGFLLKEGAKEEYYYYVYNLQGDVTGILNSAGTQVVEYIYNPYGEVVGRNGSMANTIGLKNPLKYRGYYSDNETNFYYLKSRYYAPILGRFLNADGYVSTGQGVLGHNMYAYCANNPVNRVDNDGDFWEILAVAVVGAVVNVVTTYVAAKVTNQDYSLTDGLVAAASGAANAIPTVGPFVSGAISGIYTGYSSYNNGASITESLVSGGVSAFCTTTSISNLANFAGTAMDLATNAFVDLVFGTGYNSMSAGVYKAIIDDANTSNSGTSDNKVQGNQQQNIGGPGGPSPNGLRNSLFTISCY